MGPRVLIISANIGKYDSIAFDIPSELKQIRVLRIEDSENEELFYSVSENTFVLALQNRGLAPNRVISRFPKINPLFLFSHNCKPPSLFPCGSEVINNVRSALSQFDYLVWIDGNGRINSFRELLALCLKVPPGGWGIYAHHDRSCIYKEAKCVRGFKYVNRDVLNAQMLYYKMQQMPRNYGLYSCNFIIRSKESLMQSQDFWNFWLHELLRWVPRDQLSLPYCLFKHPQYMPIVLGKFSWSNSLFSFSPHIAKK